MKHSPDPTLFLGPLLALVVALATACGSDSALESADPVVSDTMVSDTIDPDAPDPDTGVSDTVDSNDFGPETGVSDTVDSGDFGPETGVSDTMEPGKAAAVGGVRRLWIKPDLVDCVGEVPQKCMQVAEAADGEFTYFYDQIQGFSFEEGTFYVVDVLVEEVPDPPADASSLKYTLIDVIETTD